MMIKSLRPQTEEKLCLSQGSESGIIDFNDIRQNPHNNHNTISLLMRYLNREEANTLNIAEIETGINIIYFITYMSKHMYRNTIRFITHMMPLFLHFYEQGSIVGFLPQNMVKKFPTIQCRVQSSPCQWPIQNHKFLRNSCSNSQAFIPSSTACTISSRHLVASSSGNVSKLVLLFGGAIILFEFQIFLKPQFSIFVSIFSQSCYLFLQSSLSPVRLVLNTSGDRRIRAFLRCLPSCTLWRLPQKNKNI